MATLPVGAAGHKSNAGNQAFTQNEAADLLNVGERAVNTWTAKPKPKGTPIMIFSNKKQMQPTPAAAKEKFAERLDSAVADAMASGIDLRQMCDLLESRCNGLRQRWAVSAPLSQAW